MTMTVGQGVLTVAAVVLGTVLTRALPFLLFPAGKPTPRYVQYLGRVLPYAAVGLLVVYCLKGIQWLSYPWGLPEVIAIAATVLLHRLKKNMLLSIAGGTLVYMLLIHFVF